MSRINFKKISNPSMLFVKSFQAKKKKKKESWSGVDLQTLLFILTCEMFCSHRNGSGNSNVKTVQKLNFRFAEYKYRIVYKSIL